MWLIISLTTKVFSDLTVSAIQPRGEYSRKIRLRGGEGGWVNTARFLKPWPYFRSYPVQKVWNRGRSSNSRCLFGLYAFNIWITSPMKNIKNIRTPYYFMPKWFPFHTKVAPKPYPLAPDVVIWLYMLKGALSLSRPLHQRGLDFAEKFFVKYIPFRT